MGAIDGWILWFENGIVCGPFLLLLVEVPERHMQEVCQADSCDNTNELVQGTEIPTIAETESPVENSGGNGYDQPD